MALQGSGKGSHRRAARGQAPQGPVLPSLAPGSRVRIGASKAREAGLWVRLMQGCAGGRWLVTSGWRLVTAGRWLFESLSANSPAHCTGAPWRVSLLPP